MGAAVDDDLTQSGSEERLGAAAHAWRSLRFRGVRRTLRAVFARYVYSSQRFLIVRNHLAGSPVPDHLDGIVFRPATPADLGNLREFDRYGRGQLQRVYVEKEHHWMFVACDGNRIVATRRCSATVPRHELMSRVVQLAPGEFWSSDSFCLPEYRNRGLNRLFGLFMARYMATRGYKTHLSAVAVTNLPSIRSSQRKGSRFVCHVSYVRLLWSEKVRVSKELPDAFAGWRRDE
jgi:hypothetical protein